MIEERIKTFWLGLFIIIALAMIAGLLLFLRPSYGDSEKTLHIRFPNIEKVSVGTKVTYAGKAVGNVVAIEEIQNAREQPTNQRGEYYFYELLIKVDSSVKIYNYDQIVFTTTGLLGEKSIAIIPKPPPSGKSAHEITGDTLYAEGGDSLEESLSHLSKVGEVLTTTLNNINQLMDETKQPFKEMLYSVSEVSYELTRFFKDASEQNLTYHLAAGADELTKIGVQLNSSEGSMSKLLYRDDLYCELLSVITQLRLLVHDINDYGLLFQYNKRWQRMQMQRCCP